MVRGLTNENELLVYEGTLCLYSRELNSQKAQQFMQEVYRNLLLIWLITEIRLQLLLVNWIFKHSQELVSTSFP